MSGKNSINYGFKDSQMQSHVAWWMVDPGRLIGVQKGKESLGNYLLEGVEFPAILPEDFTLPLTVEMEVVFFLFFFKL